MSAKRPSRHRPNPGLYREKPTTPVELDPRYVAEIEATLAKAQKAWDKAQAALARAEKAVEQKPTAENVARRDEVRLAVLARLEELRRVEALMHPAGPSGSNWSGSGSVRRFPDGSNR